MNTKWKIATLCCMMLTLISCEKQNQHQPDVPPQPSYLSISGKVTNSAGLPLQSIQITLEKSDSWWWTDKQMYSDKDGIYSYLQQYQKLDLTQIEWPAEVTILAIDTAGIYQQQTRTVSVQIRKRYPDLPEYAEYIDGIAIADFVLREK